MRSGSAVGSACLVLLVYLVLPAAAGTETVPLSGLHAPRSDVSYMAEAALGAAGRGEAACGGCHQSCASCHKTGTRGNYYFSSRRTMGHRSCLDCHGGRGAFPGERSGADAHLAEGLSCRDCHTAMEVAEGVPGEPLEGDSRPACRSCHAGTVSGAAHSEYVHGGRLGCEACHLATMLSWTGISLEQLQEKGLRVGSPISGWLFLVNLGDRVTTANLRAFTDEGGGDTLIFVPTFSHSVTRQGRGCEECHASQAALQAGEGCLRLTWREAGSLRNLAGVVPVVEDLAFELEGRTGQMVFFTRGCEPLTPRQLEKLSLPARRSPPVRGISGSIAAPSPPE